MMNFFRKIIFEPKGLAYEVEDLPPKTFTVEGKDYKRVDLEFQSSRNKKIVGVYYVPEK